MAILLQAALAPIFICAVYIYIRDKYEKEPFSMLFLSLLYGMYSTFVILMVGRLVEKAFFHEGTQLEVFFHAFITSAGVEEGIKYVFLLFLVWKNKNFNEPFDGILYAVFISLGFAMLENIIYIFNKELGGLETALARAVFSVPGHALFGVAMGYYFSLAKYEPQKKMKYFILAFTVPYFLHGIYNFILLAQLNWGFILFIPFIIFLWTTGLKKIKQHSMISPFKR